MLVDDKEEKNKLTIARSGGDGLGGVDVIMTLHDGEILSFCQLQ